MSNQTLALLILVFPAAGALLLAGRGWRLPRIVTVIVGPGVVWLSFAVTLALFLGKASGDFTYWTWIKSGSFEAPFGLLIDNLSIFMCFVITGVGGLIITYAVGYMEHEDDPSYARFFCYMDIFVFSMLLLVLADNFIFLIVGWAMVGLSSYLLIGFWYQRHSAVVAARKAFVMNVVGDVGMILGTFVLFVSFEPHSVTFYGVFASATNYCPPGSACLHVLHGDNAALELAAFLLLVGAIAKSAQLPLHTWLPDAMEGPTPVSALIHAATMVTAGVYMVARCHKLFEMAPLGLEVVAWVGALTAVFSASIGLVQTDIKRVLAYSTISQLGYMFAGVGVGAYAAGIFHLVTHAFFKALLFLGAGSVIHGLQGEQDLKRMGGLAPRMLITTVTFLVGALGLSGVPPLAGFFSKDEILGAAFHQGHRALWALLVIGAFMTAFYSFRLVFLAFFGAPRMSREVAHHVHESPVVMTVPLVLLAVLTVVAGLAVGIPSAHGTPFARFLAPVLPLHETEHGGGVAFALLVISALVAVGGVLLAWVMYGLRPVRGEAIGVARNPVHALLLKKYYVDELYDALFVQPLYRLSEWCARSFDLEVIDGIVNGVARLVTGWAQGMRRIQTGFVMNYALGILVGAVAVIALVLSRR